MATVAFGFRERKMLIASPMPMRDITPRAAFSKLLNGTASVQAAFADDYHAVPVNLMRNSF